MVATAAEAKVGALRVVAGTGTAATAVGAKGWGVARAVEVRLLAEKVAVTGELGGGGVSTSAGRSRRCGGLLLSCGKTRSMATSIASSVVICSRMS